MVLHRSHEGRDTHRKLNASLFPDNLKRVLVIFLKDDIGGCLFELETIE
jgi:hypothetical protein